MIEMQEIGNGKVIDGYGIFRDGRMVAYLTDCSEAIKLYKRLSDPAEDGPEVDIIRRERKYAGEL